MDHFVYAGFWRRAFASFLDVIVILLVLGFPFYYVLTSLYGTEYWLGEKLVHGFWDVFMNYILPLILTVFFWRRYLGTPGKIVLDLKVVDAVSGDKLSTGQAVGRYFAYLVSIIPLGLGFIWIAFDSRKQGWHDKLAGTVVVIDSNS